MTSVQNWSTVPAMTGPRQITGAVSSSRSTFIDITSMPVLLFTGRMPSSVPVAFSVMPNIFGTDGPVMSASRIAACKPHLCAVTAKSAVVSDLPTPPLPLTTPMTFLIFESSCGAFLKSRSAQSLEQLLRSCVQFSAMFYNLPFFIYSKLFGSYSAFL